MKMRKIVAIVAAVLMLFSVIPFSAMAADTTVVFQLGADGSATHADGSSASTYSATVDGYTLSITGGNKMYTGARDAKGNSCIKLGTGSAAGSFTISNIPQDVSAVVIAVAAYKAKTATMNINGTTTALTTKSDNGQYDEITVDTTSTKSISVAVSSGYRAMVNSITYVISAPVSADCDHDSLECGETCEACDAFTKEHKYSNNCVAECENGCGTANPNYADHVYAGIYDVKCDVCLANRVIEGMPAADSELTIAQAIDLGKGVGTNGYTEGKYYVTGVITEIYNTTYGNLYITDGENTFTVYGLYDGNGNRFDAMAEKPEAGMTIKVYGIIGNYNGDAQMKNGDLIEATGGCEHVYEYECSTTCEVCGYGEREAVCVTDAEYACADGQCIYCGNDVAALEHDFDDEWDGDCNYGCGYTREVEDRPAISEHTIQFDSGKTQRTEFSTTKQVWSDGTLTFTNNKAASSNAVADYTNPARLYAGSDIVIECGGMTEIVFDCNGASYATALKNSIGDAATVNSDKVTVTFDESVDSFTVAKLTAQVRIDSITVTAVRKGDDDCAHQWSEATCTEPATCALCGAVDGEALGHDWEIISQQEATCTAAGSIVYECAACGEDKTETFPALLHTYVDGICSGCGAELPLEATITFDADKTQRIEFGNESQTWANTGLVLINNKGSYNQNLGDYSNPLRMYKGTEIIISFPGMTSLVIDGPASADYAWDDTLAGYTFTKADGAYTITFAEPTDSITLTAANQVRANKITASRVVPCAHEYDNACDVDCNLCYETREVSHNSVHVEAKAPTCAEMGNIEYWYCDVCGMAWLDEACTQNTNLKAVKLSATGEHEYDNACDVDCNLCYETREVTHNVVHVEAVAATCTAMGNIEYWFCDVCGMAWLDAECTLPTNLRAVVLPMAEHTYENCLDADCDVCGATREPGHNLTYTPAKEAIDCANPGNVEYWFCSGCNEYFADAYGNEYINPWHIQITVDCVRPEGIADCATVTCETCGNEIYGYGEHDVLACQGGTCSKCNGEIEGYGCSNSTTPACEDGVCDYCGGFVAGFGHENGAWAPCLDGECSHGCGLTYPATEDHVDEDGNDYCDNCWNHLACIDEDGDGFCDICWSEMPEAPVVEILYGDANGDGEITLMDATLLSQYLSGWDVEIDPVASDANGDGEITLMDATLLSQYLSGWDVTLGPAEDEEEESKIYNDGVLGGW